MSSTENGWLDEIINETYAPRHIDQGTEAWDDIRLGRFTSSKWYRLMECGKRPMTEEEKAARPKKGPGSKTTLVPDPSKMSKPGIEYIHEKVWETLTGQTMEQAYAYPLVFGKEQEQFAVDHFEKITGLRCDNVGFQPYTEYAGGSPDRLIGDKEGLEVKCPISDEQIKYLMLTDHYDLKREYPDKYWQCVTLLLFTNRERWHFCTYDGRMKLEKNKMTHIIIEAEKVQDDMIDASRALEGAVEEKLKLIQLLS